MARGGFIPCASAAALLILVASQSAGASSTRPTLRASNGVAGLPAVVYSEPITLSGAETLGGTKTFVVQQSVFPFHSGFRTIHKGTTAGSYSFVVRPQYATRYRVYIVANGKQGPTSRVLAVYALARTLSSSCNLCSVSDMPGAHTLLVSGSFELPPGTISSRGPAYFYYGQSSSSLEPARLRLGASVPRYFKRHRFSVVVSYRVTFPSSAFKFAYDVCWKSAESKDGVGLPGNHHCGEQLVTRGEYLG